MKRSRAAKEDWLKRAVETRLSAAEQKELSSALRLISQLLES
jgi:hypothetical protein